MITVGDRDTTLLLSLFGLAIVTTTLLHAVYVRTHRPDAFVRRSRIP